MCARWNANTKTISIHALRMERDVSAIVSWAVSAAISIHALRMERDWCPSTTWQKGKYFYPRAPHGARRVGFRLSYKALGISIHALRMERDAGFDGELRLKLISIHALRMERDFLRQKYQCRSA